MTYPASSLQFPPELRPPLVVERPKGSGVYVKIKDSLLRCIVYLGWPIAGTTDQLDAEGTGFFVFHDGAFYIVTAAHVAHRMKDVPFGIRLNTRADGQGRIEYFDRVKWYEHQTDTTVDVAVFPFTPPAWARANAFPTGSVLTEFKREAKKIGPGDIAYVVGIFKLLPGEKRNNPVVHVGHLASFAEGEAIPTFDWRSNEKPTPELRINGYIVQVDTMPQASGSPVFVRRSFPVDLPDPDAKPKPVQGKPHLQEISVIRGEVYGSIWLLGLWHGAWTDDVSKMLGLSKGSVNLGMGMGVTIPAPRILEVLNQPELVAMRKAEQKTEARVTPQVEPKATAKVRDEILRTMLSTPPQPRKKSAPKPVKSK